MCNYDCDALYDAYNKGINDLVKELEKRMRKNAYGKLIGFFDSVELEKIAEELKEM